MTKGTQVARISAVLFDKDGTLFDFHATWGSWTHGFIRELAGDADRAEGIAKAMRYDLAQRRFHPDSPVIAGSVANWAQVIRPLLPEFTEPALVDRIITASAMAPQIPAAPLVPLLEGLREDGLSLGIATNDGVDSTSEHLAEAGVHHLFDFIAGYDSGYGPKPGPGMLLAFAREVGVPAAEVLMVGDSTHDLYAAKAAGMPGIGVLTGMAAKSVLEPLAEAILPTIADLPGWIATRNTTA